MHLVTGQFMQLNIQMIQHVMFFRLQFSPVVQVPFFFFFQLYLGIVLATVVIITGCFSYYQVSVPAFNTLNKIPNIKGIYIFFCNPSGYMQNLLVEKVYGDYGCM